MTAPSNIIGVPAPTNVKRIRRVVGGIVGVSHFSRASRLISRPREEAPYQPRKNDSNKSRSHSEYKAVQQKSPSPRKGKLPAFIFNYMN